MYPQRFRLLTLVLLTLALMLPAPARSLAIAVEDSSDPQFEPLSTLGEGVYALAVAGSFMYAIEGSTLTILDLSNPVKPVRLGQATIEGDVSAIRVAGGLAFVFCTQTIYYPSNPVSWSYITAIDIRDPTQPILRETYQGGVAVQVTGNRAYISTGAGLEIVDISNPARLVSLGRYVAPDGSGVGNVQVVGTRAYIASGMIVQIVDMRDPTRPALLGSCEMPERPGTLQVAGNFIYVFGKPGLWVIDASEPARPALRGKIPLPDWVRQMQVVGTRVYVTGGYSSSAFLVIDVSDPDYPHMRGKFDTPGMITSVEIVGEIAYIASTNESHGMVQAVQVSNPDQLVAVSAVYPKDAWDIQVVGDRLYVAAGPNGLPIVSLRPPYTITPGDMLSVSISATWVAGNRIYALMTQEGEPKLAIIDARNLRRPRLLTMVATFGEVTDVQANGDHIYLAGAAGLVIYDVRDPASPILESISYSADGAKIMQVVGPLVYIATKGGQFRIIDVSEPAYPALRATYQAPQGIVTFQVRDGFAYLLDYSGLHIIDVRDPATPTHLGDYTTDPSAWQALQVVGDRAYLVSEYPFFAIVDLHDRAAPAWLGSLTLPVSDAMPNGPNFAGMLLRGNRVYLAYNYSSSRYMHHGTFLTIDVQDPAAPTMLNRSNHAPIDSMQVAGNLAYLTTGLLCCEGTIEVLDLADVAAPSLDNYATTFLEQMQVVGEVVYLKSFISGLQILRVHTELLPAGATILPEGGSLTTHDGSLHISFPPGAVASIASVSYTGSLTPTHPLNPQRGVLRSFTLAAQGAGAVPITQLNHGATLAISYTDTLLASQLISDAEHLNLVAWDGQVWVDLLPCEGCEIDRANHQVIAPIERLTEFVLVGERRTTFMPLVAHYTVLEKGEFEGASPH